MTDVPFPFDDDPVADPTPPNPADVHPMDAAAPSAAALIAVVDAVDPIVRLLEIREPDAIRTGVAGLRGALVDRVRRLIDEHPIPDTVTSSTDVRDRATRLADAADLLAGLSGAFGAAAKEATSAAGELVLDVPTRDGKPRRTLRFGDGYGSDLLVSLTPTTETFADLDVIVDVLVADRSPGYSADPKVVEPYAAGMRAGIRALREILSASPSVRTTALDGLVLDLEDGGETALAGRLRAAYGRREKGEPRAKVERKDRRA